MVPLLSLFSVTFCLFGLSHGALDVYLLPHTHLDVGWLQTFDTYYYLNVSQMLPGIIDNLNRDSTKRFAWAEITYFQKWWAEASDSEKQTLRRLVANKQFEFVDGGLVQHDQAAPTIHGIVSQMTEGVKFVLDNFGSAARPRIGWSLDPFGSSASNAAIYGLSGYDALVINRIPDVTMNQLKSSKGLQFVWYGSASLNKTDSGVFTHILDSYFCSPDGFRWSWSQADSPQITPSNVADRANTFASEVLPRAAWFRTNQLFIPWGCDFMYVNATVVFQNTDQLIREVNNNPTKYNFTLRYATPTEFFTAIHGNTGIQWPVRNNIDFFPLVYGTKPNMQVWTGYYTSRPKLKKQNRVAIGAIQSADIAFTLASSSLPTRDLEFKTFTKLGQCFSNPRTQTRRSKYFYQPCTTEFSASDDLELLSDAKVFNAIALHHDAITGTMCQALEGCTGGGQGAGDHSVLEDYLRYQAEAIVNAETVLADSIAILLAKNTSSLPSVFTVVPNRDYGAGGFGYNTLLNKEFSVGLMQRKTVAVIVHNPLAWTRTEQISLKVPVHGIKVTDTTGATVASQTLTEAFTSTGRASSGYPETYDQTLTWVAKVPALGYTTYFLTPCQVTSAWPFPCVNSPSELMDDGETKKSLLFNDSPQSGASFTLSNNYFTIYADDQNGLLAYYDKASSRNFTIGLHLRAYPAANPGFNSDNAYTFGPAGPSQPIAGSLTGAVLQTNGLMDQLYLRVSYEYGVYLRVFHTGNSDVDSHLEIQFDLGLVTDMTDLVAEFSTDFGSNHLYTDGNAFELYERVQNPSVTTQENSWPQQSSVVVQDSAGKYELSLLTELSHAVILESAQSSGKFQVMISRRFSTTPDVSYDDKLDQSQKMWLILGATSTVAQLRRSLLPRVQYPLRFTGSLVTTSTSDFNSRYRTSLSPLASPLPPNIHLFTLGPLRNSTDGTSTTILRLQHLYQVGEDTTLSQPVTINLSQLFSLPPLVISSLVEKTLVYSINKSDLQRWVWPTAAAMTGADGSGRERSFSDDFIVTLNPLEVRTYQVTFKTSFF